MSLAILPRSARCPGPARLAWSILAMFLWGAILIPTARADGGHVALHATSGSYTVTLFTTPVPLAAGPADLTLLVQRAQARSGGTQESVEDVRASGVMQLASGSAIALHFAQASTDSPLLSAEVSLPAAGNYALTLVVSSPHEPSATFQATLSVEANHSRRTTVILALLAPPAAIFLFLINQHAKARAYSRTCSRS